MNGSQVRLETEERKLLSGTSCKTNDENNSNNINNNSPPAPSYSDM